MNIGGYWAITARYSGDSGAPDVLLVTDDEQVARAYLGMIERADPMKTIALTTLAAVIISRNTTQPQEGNPQ